MKTYIIKITALDENGNEVPVLEGEKFTKRKLEIETDADGFLLISTNANQQSKADSLYATVIMANMDFNALSTCFSSHPYLFSAADAALRADLAGAKRSHDNKGETK